MEPQCDCQICMGKCPQCRAQGCGMCNWCKKHRISICPHCYRAYQNSLAQMSQAVNVPMGEGLTFGKLLCILLVTFIIYMLMKK